MRNNSEDKKKKFLFEYLKSNLLIVDTPAHHIFKTNSTQSMVMIHIKNPMDKTFFNQENFELLISNQFLIKITKHFGGDKSEYIEPVKNWVEDLIKVRIQKVLSYLPT